MSCWAGVALALRSPGEDRMASRLATYLHPLAGRPLAWHTIRAMADLDPPPRQLFLVTLPSIDLSPLAATVPADVVVAPTPGRWWARIAERLVSPVERLLLVDAAAPLLLGSLARLVSGPPGRVVRAADGEPVALWQTRARVAELAEEGLSFDAQASDLETVPPADPAEAVVVRDRRSLAHAVATIRDRLVANHMAAGVTFLLPETVLVDVDVAIGPDTVIYPGVVLEGSTKVGAETVIGPGCRIVDSWIGSGVELKGWNYIVNTSIRNRAVLEPYVRRGFD
jgi:hypothetical protein